MTLRQSPTGRPIFGPVRSTDADDFSFPANGSVTAPTGDPANENLSDVPSPVRGFLRLFRGGAQAFSAIREDVEALRKTEEEVQSAKRPPTVEEPEPKNTDQEPPGPRKFLTKENIVVGSVVLIAGALLVSLMRGK